MSHGWRLYIWSGMSGLAGKKGERGLDSFQREDRAQRTRSLKKNGEIRDKKSKTGIATMKWKIPTLVRRRTNVGHPGQTAEEEWESNSGAEEGTGDHV